jgi:hypothetical protein
MALQQTTVVDLIQVDESGSVLVRQRTDIFDDTTPTNIIASQYHRDSFAPGSDLTDQPANVAAIANVAWTPKVIAAYQAQQAAQKAQLVAQTTIATAPISQPSA